MNNKSLEEDVKAARLDNAHARTSAIARLLARAARENRLVLNRLARSPR